jgi:hypothetical protein
LFEKERRKSFCWIFSRGFCQFPKPVPQAGRAPPAGSGASRLLLSPSNLGPIPAFFAALPGLMGPRIQRWGTWLVSSKQRYAPRPLHENIQSLNKRTGLGALAHALHENRGSRNARRVASSRTCRAGRNRAAGSLEDCRSDQRGAFKEVLHAGDQGRPDEAGGQQKWGLCTGAAGLFPRAAICQAEPARTAVTRGGLHMSTEPNNNPSQGSTPMDERHV